MRRTPMLFKIFLFGLMVTSTHTVSVLDPCNFWDDAVYIKGKCFKAFTDQWLDWEGAQSACGVHSSSGRLAELTDIRQRDAFRKHVMEIQQFADGFKGWVGARFDTAKNKHTWIHDTETAVPGNYHNVAETCLYVMTSPTATLAFRSNECENLQYYVCEQEVANPCDHFLPGAEYFHGSCFQASDSEAKFSLAEVSCNRKGAFLAETRELDVIDFVKSIQSEMNQKTWLGIHGISVTHNGAIQNHWMKSGLDVNNTELGVSMINDDSKCMSLDTSQAFIFATCTDLNRYICQKEIGDPCEISYLGSMYSSGFCFEYIDTAATFDEAEEICMSKNGYLAEQQTQEIYDFVVNYMMYKMKDHKGCDARGSAPVWIGLTHLEDDTSSRWRTNGAPADTRSVQFWPEWYDNFGAGDFCAVLTSFGEWEQRACGSRQFYVCQTEITNTTDHRYVIPLSFWQAPVSSPPDQVYLTVTCPWTSHTIYVTIKMFKSDPSLPHKTIYTMVSRERDYTLSLQSFLSYYKLIEVKVTHPLTVTLVRSKGTQLSSTLIYPTLHDSSPWLFDRDFYVIASALMPGERKVNTLLIVPVEEGQTTVTIRNSSDVASSGSMVLIDKYVVHELSETDTDNMYDGFHISGSKEVVVFFMQRDQNSSMLGPVTMNQLPPYSLLSDEVIALPASATGMVTDAMMKVASLDETSHVAIPYTMVQTYPNLDPEISGEVYAQYISDTVTAALDVVLVKFTSVGQVSSSYTASHTFVVQSGNAPFYSTQSFTLKTMSGSFCTLAPLPQTLWSYRYVAMLLPGVFGSSSQVSRALLYLVVESNLTDAIFIDEKIREFDCVQIEDTDSLSGCWGDLEPSEYQSGQALTIETSLPLAAYVFMVSEGDLTCYPLGLNLPPENFYSGPIDINSTTVTLLPPETTTHIPAVTTQPPTTQETVTNQTTVDPCPTFPTTAPPSDVTTNLYNASTNGGGSNPDITTVGGGGGGSGLPPSPQITTGATPTYECTIPTDIKTNLTMEEEQKLVETIQKDLVISASNTTAAKRKKSSAVNKKKSSAYIGWAGIFLFSLEVCIIVVPDAINIYRFFKE